MTPFELGWNDGAIERKHATPREAQQRYPHMSGEQIVEYLNGRDDGVSGDYWRMAKVRKQQAELWV
jgi:hypothetical protein